MAVRWRYTEEQLRGLAASPHAAAVPTGILPDVARPLPPSPKKRAWVRRFPDRLLATSYIEGGSAVRRWVPKAQPAPRPFRRPDLVPASCFHISDHTVDSSVVVTNSTGDGPSLLDTSDSSDAVPVTPIPLHRASYDASAHTGLTDSESSEDEEEGTRARLPVSVLLEHLDLPIFHELRLHTNLNLPPPNWLFNDLRLLAKYNPAHPRAAGDRAEFSSALLAAPASLLMIEDRKAPPRPKQWQVDFISSSENIKKLFMGPYTSAGLALSIHKVGSSLVLEGEMGPAQAVLPQRLSGKSTRDKMLESKFVYYSILADTQGSPPKPPPPPPPTAPAPPSLAVSTRVVGSPGTAPELEPRFCRTLRWKFRDLNLLLGSEAFLMREPTEGTTVALRLQDAEEPITQETALDLWLDNLMANVPDVALCYHREGIVQGYQLVSTQELPNLACAGFDPKVVEEYAGSVLNWLKDRCTNDAGSYLLVREPGSSQLMLYDLSDLYHAAGEDPEGVEPLQYSLGMMCYRMADKLLEGKTPETQTEARRLLQRSVDLLKEDQDPMVLAAAHEHLAHSYLEEGPVEVEAVAEPTKKDRRRKAKTAGQAAEPGSESSLGGAGLLVPKDAHREHTALAADHLVKSLQILARVVLPDERKHEQMAQMWRQSVRCYMDVAQHDAAQGRCADALRWVAKAQHAMLLLQREVRSHSLNKEASRSMQSPAAQAPDAGAPDRNADEVAWKQLSTCGILDILGDVHLYIGRQLQNEPQAASPAPPWLEDLRRTVADLVAQQDAATEWDFLRQCHPLAGEAEAALRKALRMYTTGRALAPPAGDGPALKARLGAKAAEAHAALGAVYRGDGRFSKAREQYAAALQLAEAGADPAQRAVLHQQVGEMYLQQADLLNSCGGSGLSVDEQKAIHSAIESFKCAADLGSDTLRTAAERNAGAAHLRLADRLNRRFTSLIREQPGTDWEKAIEELLLTAAKHFGNAGHPSGTARAHCGLAALYSAALAELYNPTGARDMAKIDERRMKMAEFYWRKAAEAPPSECPEDGGPVAVEARCGWAELELRIAQREGRPPQRCLERALHHLCGTADWLQAYPAHPGFPAAASVVVETLRRALLSLVKRKGAEGGDLRQLCKAALTAQPGDVARLLDAVRPFAKP